MKKQFFRRFMVFALALVMIVGAFADLKEISVSAKKAAPGKPKVSIRVLENNAGIKMTIGKTKNADGYAVCVNLNPEGIYSLDGEIFCVNNIRYEYSEKAVYIGKNGKKKRTFNIKASDIFGSDFETLYPGTYSIQVKAYIKGKNGKKTYGSKSKSISLNVPLNTGAKRVSADVSADDFTALKQGDIVKFGAYEQDCNFANGPDPIEWIVLSKTGSQLLLLSRYALDRLPYNTEEDEITIWKVCSLRRWLNKKFYDIAFSDSEKELIGAVTNKNPYYITDTECIPGTDTKDKVFILSAADVTNADYGFNSDGDEEDPLRKGILTKYAKARGATEICWLRTLREDDDYWESVAKVIYYEGVLYKRGYIVSYDYEYDDDEDYGLDIGLGIAVRPAIVIDLEKSGDDHWEEEWDDKWSEEDYWDGFDGNSDDDDEDEWDLPELGQTVKGCVIDATSGVVPREGGINLLDDDKYTKFCFMAKSGYIIWEAPEALQVESYTLMTGNDTLNYKRRNPKSWILYGANTELPRDSKDWEIIDSVTDDKKMKAKNYKEYTFELETPAKAYKYYKLEILENKGDVCTQLSELTLYQSEGRFCD